MRRAAFVVARSKDRETGDGMVYLGSDRDTETQEQGVDDTCQSAGTPKSGRSGTHCILSVQHRR